MKSEILTPDEFTVLPCVERPESKIADDRDTESIREQGIRIPVVAVEHDGKRYLAKGLRRLRIAKRLNVQVPTVTHPLPKGREIEEYVRELRFWLSQHFQQLAPSQKAEIVKKIKAMRISEGKVTNKVVAKLLGVDQDTITNILAIDRYAPEIVREIDAGKLTMQRARAFDGITEEGQRIIWKEHAEDIKTAPGKSAQKFVRKKYSPKKHPDFYLNPDRAAERIAKKSEPSRVKKPRKTVTTSEVRRATASVEMKELELREGEKELRENQKNEISPAIVPITAILRSDDLRAKIPAEIIEGFEVFIERFG